MCPLLARLVLSRQLPEHHADLPGVAKAGSFGFLLQSSYGLWGAMDMYD